MLQQQTDIEGLAPSFIDTNLKDDTPPGVTQVRFSVVSEEMPFLSNQKGERVTQSFVYVTKIMNLGNSMIHRRIRDKVEFDKSTGKWKILQLAVKSDIRDHKDEWNAFYRGASEDFVFGTPLVILFKNDPARADFYKSRHITSIEQLSRCNDSDTQMLGLGAREEVAKAREFIARSKEHAPAIAANSAMEEKDRQIQSLQSQVEDLGQKLTELLNAQIEAAKEGQKAPAKRGPVKRTPKVETPTGIEGLGA